MLLYVSHSKTNYDDVKTEIKCINQGLNKIISKKKTPCAHGFAFPAYTEFWLHNKNSTKHPKEESTTTVNNLI